MAYDPTIINPLSVFPGSPVSFVYQFHIAEESHVVSPSYLLRSQRNSTHTVQLEHASV